MDATLYTDNGGGYWVELPKMVLYLGNSYSQERFREDHQAVIDGDWSWQEYASENPDDVYTPAQFEKDFYREGEYAKTHDLPTPEAAYVDGSWYVGREACKAAGLR